MPGRAGTPTRLHRLLTWTTLVLICFGLGYPTLNRYDPRQLLPDAGKYGKLAQEGPGDIPSPFRFRILVPYLARAIYLLSQGRAGTWDPLLFGFLVVNSIFVATTAYLTYIIGESLLGNSSTALFASALYLLNFAVSNAQLAALVDSGEALFLMAVVVSMFYRRCLLLPLFGVLGALTKESFVPCSIFMAVTWWRLSPPDVGSRRGRTLTSVIAMIAAECVAVIVVQSVISRHLVWPWDFAFSLNSHANYAANFLHSLLDRSSWYILIWLLPIGLMRIREFPRQWVTAAAVASACALGLNAYHSTVEGGGGGIGRYVFDIAGPLLSISAAACLTGLRHLPQSAEYDPFLSVTD
jgi:hypothetical protein